MGLIDRVLHPFRNEQLSGSEAVPELAAPAHQAKERERELRQRFASVIHDIARDLGVGCESDVELQDERALGRFVVSVLLAAKEKQVRASIARTLRPRLEDLQRTLNVETIEEARGHAHELGLLLHEVTGREP